MHWADVTITDFCLCRYKSVLNIHWQDWCWSWNSNTLATWCKELTHLKRPWCWERWKVGGEGNDRGWDGWMASSTQRTWVWVNSRSWWWTGRPGVLQSTGSQRVRHDWATELRYHLQRQPTKNSPSQIPWVGTMGRLTPKSRARRVGKVTLVTRSLCLIYLTLESSRGCLKHWCGEAGRTLKITWEGLWQMIPFINAILYFSFCNHEPLILFLFPFLLWILPFFLPFLHHPSNRFLTCFRGEALPWNSVIFTSENMACLGMSNLLFQGLTYEFLWALNFKKGV